MSYSAQPLRRENIRLLASKVRKLLGLENVLRIPILEILEHLHEIVEDARYEIVSPEELSDPDAHAETDIMDKCIKIREDVYDGAWAGNGRDRMTIAHEFGHFILILVCGVKLYRIFDEEKIPAYKDPEWHAKCFAGEFMINKNLVKNMTVLEVAEKCGVSFDAAEFQLSKF